MKRTTILHPPKGLIIALIAIFCCAWPFQSQACKLAKRSQATPLEVVAGASNKFGLQLYKTIAGAKPLENQFISPFSVWAALSMTSEGAGGSTLAGLSKVLGLPEATVLHAGLTELSQALERKDAPYALAVANAIWPEKTAKIEPQFLATIQKVYHGASTPLDFKGQTEASRLQINAWVEKQTNNRIKNLIPGGAIDASTTMVLTNAIFFKGKWKNEFDKQLTQDQPFFQEDGKQVVAPLMYQPAKDDAKLGYAEIDGLQVLQLPYKGDDLSMVILLPERGKISKLEKVLDASKWESISQVMRYEQVNVWLPRFKMELGGSIATSLKAMGLGELFETCDFSRMFTGGGDFVVSDVIHKAFVEVNEEGTEAAAATAVLIKETSARIDEPDPIMNFRADHPFIFMIQHNQSKSILFMGKVMNPGN